MADDSNGLISPAAGAMVTLAALVAVPYVLPGLARLRLLTPLPEGSGLVTAPAAPSASVGEAKLVAETTVAAELSQPEREAPPPEVTAALPATSPADKPPRSIEDPSGVALDGFFRA